MGMVRGKFAVGAVLAVLLMAVSAAYSADAAKGTEKALKASEITGKVFPERVFFRGQVASVQMRNSAGIHYADDAYVLAALVDNSGYSTEIKEKYQGYLMTEVALEIGGQKLPAGVYGFGFVNGKFIVMDVGAHDLLTAPSAKDADLKRPVPFQITGGDGKYRIYGGRDYVEVSRAQ
jgi:hypothetical protein